MPTDTLYGLAADVFNPAAVDRIFEVKGRSETLALPVLVNGWDQVRWVAKDVPQQAGRLAERFWPGFCEAIGEPEWASDPRYASLEGLMEHAAELRVAIDERFRRHDLDYWAEQLDRHGLLWAPMAELPEVIDDPQLRALGAFTTVEHPQAGTFETIAAPFQIENADIRVRGAAPAAGEHTAEVLEELGLGADEVAELAQQGIFG